LARRLRRRGTSRIRVREKIERSQRDAKLILLSSPDTKNILIPFFRKVWFCPSSRLDARGRIAIVTTREAGMRWTCWFRPTSDADADGEVVWS
jgi:hypothetical protein